jgi:hypothetical protein
MTAVCLKRGAAQLVYTEFTGGMCRTPRMRQRPSPAKERVFGVFSIGVVERTTVYALLPNNLI